MDIRQAQELLQSVEKYVGKVGLKITSGKTKYNGYVFQPTWKCHHQD